jgi:AraC-like DNA-binding protein
MSGRLARIQRWEDLAKEANYHLEEMASLCGVTQRQMQRYFKKHFRSTPRHWLRELQCKTAKELISKGLSSKAAALDVGFATESHFCREFKKVFGVSPQSFSPHFPGPKS